MTTATYFHSLCSKKNISLQSHTVTLVVNLESWTFFRGPDGVDPSEPRRSHDYRSAKMREGGASLQDHLHIWSIQKYYPPLGTHTYRHMLYPLRQTYGK